MLIGSGPSVGFSFVCLVRALFVLFMGSICLTLVHLWVLSPLSFLYGLSLSYPCSCFWSGSIPPTLPGVAPSLFWHNRFFIGFDRLLVLLFGCTCLSCTDLSYGHVLSQFEDWQMGLRQDPADFKCTLPQEAGFL